MVNFHDLNTKILNFEQNMKGLYLLKFLNAAVSSNSPLISSGYGFSFTSVNGFISKKLKSRSMHKMGVEKRLDFKTVHIRIATVLGIANRI